ncbi:MAG: VOC family protein [Bdellovibrionales bacterium]
MNIANALEGAYGSMYYVRDMQKAVQYYKDMFDLKPISESPGWSEFDWNGHKVCLHLAEPSAEIDGKAIFIAKVKGLTGIVAELKKRGVEFSKDIHSVCEGGYAADFRDSSGNLLSLFEYTGE